MRLLAFDAAQRVWLGARTAGRALFGAKRLDGWLDASGLRELKYRHWLSRRTMPDGSRIIYRPHDQCILYEVYNRDVYSGSDILEGEVVVDVGAHIGTFALLAARRVGPRGRVIAFEPSPRTFELLRLNIAANDVPWLTAHEAALSDHEGEASFYVAAKAAHNPVADSLSPQPDKNAVRVSLRRLDDVLEDGGLDRVDHLKIDAEGEELKVLAGAPRAIASARRIVMEVHPPAVEPRDVIRLLTPLGFDCRIVAEGGEAVILSARRKRNPADH